MAASQSYYTKKAAPNNLTKPTYKTLPCLPAPQYAHTVDIPKTHTPPLPPLYKYLNLLVAYAAPSVLSAPINKQIAIPFGPSFLTSPPASPASSGLFPGSSTEKTISEMKVPTNCGSVV